MLQAVKELFRQSENFENALPELTQMLSKNFDVQWVGYWNMDKQTNILRPMNVWCSSVMHAEAFEEDAHNRLFCPGEGMIGKVWRLQTPASSTNLIKDMMLPRSLKAYGAGFREGLWFPVCIEKRAYGVFEMLKSKFTFFDKETLRLLELLGEDLASCIRQN